MGRSLFVSIVALHCALVCAAQGPVGSESKSTGVVLVELSRPTYPPLAKTARITGDVILTLHVQADGKIGSIDVVSGHPMLKQVALESAKQSRFECMACTEPTSYEL